MYKGLIGFLLYFLIISWTNALNFKERLYLKIHRLGHSDKSKIYTLECKKKSDSCSLFFQHGINILYSEVPIKKIKEILDIKKLSKLLTPIKKNHKNQTDTRIFMALFLESGKKKYERDLYLIKKDIELIKMLVDLENEFSKFFTEE